MNSNKLRLKSLTQKDKEYMEWWDSIAFEYESKVLSPLYHDVKNPIFEFVDKLDFRNYKRAVDLGCGKGKFLSFLSQHFTEVWGFEWSKNMLRIAEKNCKGSKNVHLKRLDIRNMKSFHMYFDIAFSINTIAPHDISVAKDMVKEIFEILRTHGLFVVIFPSFDTVLYQRELTYTGYIEQGLGRKEAQEKTDDYFSKRNKIDLKKGLYAEDGIHVQKFFTNEEVCSMLQGIGFTVLTSEKVLYPWELSRKYGYGYFPDKPEIWDWFFVARKKDHMQQPS